MGKNADIFLELLVWNLAEAVRERTFCYEGTKEEIKEDREGWAQKRKGREDELDQLPGSCWLRFTMVSGGKETRLDEYSYEFVELFQVEDFSGFLTVDGE